MSIDITKQLNKLKLTETSLTDEVNNLLEQKKELDRLYADKKKELERVKDEIKKLSDSLPKSVTISDHAMLRYLERVKNVNLQEIEKEILTDSIIQSITQLNTCRLITKAGYKLVVKNRNVITVLLANDE